MKGAGPELLKLLFAGDVPGPKAGFVAVAVRVDAPLPEIPIPVDIEGGRPAIRLMPIVPSAAATGSDSWPSLRYATPACRCARR